MKAWERQRQFILNEEPCYNQDDNEIFWEEQSTIPEEAQNALCKLHYHSNVPGSRASESIVLAAIQATENKGMIVPNAMEMYDQGCKAEESGDMATAIRIQYEIFEACNNAIKDETSPYWNQTFYDTFEDYEKAVEFPKTVEIKYDENQINKQHGGWLSQIIGGAYGTCIEGYTGTNIKKKYGGEVKTYIRKPNTYNDDITYELALLLAYEAKGKKTTTIDIANEWLARIPSGWSAEEWAMNNLKAGIMPPMSGRCNNPFNEWIGAQMRGAICGQIYPGNVRMAAKAAFEDATISHCRNGILGEVFNAIMVSMAFYENDVKKILIDAINLIPEDSEYGKVIRFALKQCQSHDDYDSAWLVCEKEYERYNWIHAYPNAASEVVALWFGDGDFTKTISICGGCGQDVDCNAAQVMTIIGIIGGVDAIPEYFKNPFGDHLDTYCRQLKVMSIKDLAVRTAKVAETLK